MKRDIIVDTCSFIDFFRGDDASIIPSLAAQDRIVLSNVVRLELLKGTGRAERRALLSLLEGFRQLIDFPPADLTERILFQLHGRGFCLGFPDLLILADAVRGKCALLTSDQPLAKAAAALKLPAASLH